MRRKLNMRVVARILVVLLIGSLHTNMAPANDEINIVSEIRVLGNKRIERATVISYLKINRGDKYDSDKIDDSLKSLFNTGLFADVNFKSQNDILIIKVVENPIINSISFEGNKRLTNEILVSEISLRPRVVYTRTKVKNDVKRLLNIYRRSGRFGATVEPKAVKLSENRVDLIYEVNEGPLNGIRSINFIGNQKYSDRKLRNVIQTDESTVWNFLSSDDSYDPDRISFDKELLRRFYLSEGYADFRVVSAIAELTEDQEDFIITFTIVEGSKYKFGDVDVNLRLRNINIDELRSLIVGKKNKVYDANQVEETIQALTVHIGALGFAFVDIRPRVKRNREEKIINVTYDISEGSRVYVERINIRGNLRTLDKVIRREFTLSEGDAFNTAKLRKARQDLQNLGFFSRVDIINEPSIEPDYTIIDVDVEEKSTGELSIGAGFSSTAGPLGDVSIRERNLLGRGQDLKLSLSLGTEEQKIDLSFTEPYFLNRSLAAGFDLFARTTDRTNESSFQEDQQGFALRTGYYLGPKLRHSIRYTLYNNDIAGVDTTASKVVQSQAGSLVTSSIKNELYFNMLNRNYNPTDGYFGSYNVEIAGIGGSSKFLRNKLKGGYYTSLFDTSIVANISAEAGHVFTFNDDTVPLMKRFNLGGVSLRGFDNAGVGPRDLVTGDAIGGHQFYSGTAELTFPLGLPKEVDIKGSIFTDFGSAWGMDDPFSDLVDDANPRASFGIGFGWASPIGPLRFDFANAFMKEEYDKTRTFNFNFGARF